MRKLIERYKNYTAAIFFLSLFGLLIVSQSYLKDDMDKNGIRSSVKKPMFSDNIRVINNTDFDLELKTKILADSIFGYDSLTIKYEYMGADFSAYHGFKAYIKKDRLFPNHYVIYLSPLPTILNDMQINSTLAHEFIHLDQHESGRFEILNNCGGWVKFDSDTLNLNFLPYRARPYEIEAYAKEDSIESVLFNILYKQVIN